MLAIRVDWLQFGKAAKTLVAIISVEALVRAGKTERAALIVLDGVSVAAKLPTEEACEPETDVEADYEKSSDCIPDIL